MANDNTTGHVWDEDLRELNNPLPRWWMWLFVATVVFSAVYLAFYPGLGTNPGTLNWSSQGQYQAEQDKARAAMAPVYAKFTPMKAEDLMKDEVAMGIGQRLFLNNCSGCHGSDGRGSKGFPNLTDNDWLGAASPEYIAKVVVEGRTGMMPPMAAAVGAAEDVKNVANYVLSLSGSGAQQRRGRTRQGQIRSLCRLPRAGRQGQPGAGCPEPDGQDLAARLGRAGHREHGDQRQDQRHAGTGPTADAGTGACAERLRLEPVAAAAGGQREVSEKHA